MDREAWRAVIHGVTKSQTWLSDWTELNWLPDNIQPWHTPFPIWNQSVVPCPVLTIASWPPYRFLKKQVRCSGIPIFFLKRSLVFPVQLFSSISLHGSLRKAFLPLLAVLWNSAFKWEYLSFSALIFASLLFTAVCKASSDSHFAFLHFFFSGNGCIIMSQMGTHEDLHIFFTREN